MAFQPATACTLQKHLKPSPKNFKNVMACHKDLEWSLCHNREAADKGKCVAAAGSATFSQGSEQHLACSKFLHNHSWPKGIPSLLSTVSALCCGCGHQRITFGTCFIPWDWREIASVKGGLLGCRVQQTSRSKPLKYKELQEEHMSNALKQLHCLLESFLSSVIKAAVVFHL